MKYELTITLKEFFENSPVELYDMNAIKWGKGGCALYNVDVNGDTTFTCLIGPDKEEKAFWADNGSIVVAYQFYKTYEELLHICEKIKEGKTFCSRCGKEITGKRQHYFAGIYHDSCWTKRDEENRNWAYSHLD